MGGSIDWVMVAISLPIFMFALSVHEAAHAITAKWGGDQTAAYLGRITINPLPHIDPIGTIVMPLIGALGGIPLIGWAKPVPVVEQNFRRGDSYGIIVALAGPFSNLVIALFSTALYSIFLITFRLFFAEQFFTQASGYLLGSQFFILMIIINLALMAFNLMPIPPLDGSHVLWHGFVKHRPHLHEYFFMVRQAGFIVLLILLWTGGIGLLFGFFVMPLLSLLINLARFPLTLI